MQKPNVFLFIKEESVKVGEKVKAYNKQIKELKKTYSEAKVWQKGGFVGSEIDKMRLENPQLKLALY